MRRADPPPLPRGEYRLIFTGMELVSMLFLWVALLHKKPSETVLSALFAR
jgi:hypothetical protein